MSIELTFDEKAAIVGGTYANRYDEEGNPINEFVIDIFDRYDLGGAIAIAYIERHISFVDDEPRKWIEDIFSALTMVSDDEHFKMMKDEAQRILSRVNETLGEPVS